MNKRAISPIIASSLILVVAVISVVGFQNWFNIYQSNVYSDFDKNPEINFPIIRVEDNNLYIQYKKKITNKDKISSIRIKDKSNSQIEKCTIKIPENNLTGYYNLNNNVKDLSQYKKNGTIIGNLTSISGIEQMGYTFDGTLPLSYIDTNNNLSSYISKSEGTYNLWVKPFFNNKTDSVFNLPYILGDIEGYTGIIIGNFNLNENKIWIYNFDSNSDYIGIEYTQDKWINIALVHKNNQLYGYKNGVLIGNVSSGDTDLLFGNLQIGSGYGGESNVSIDEVRIYNKGLNSTEILNIYTLTKPLTNLNTINLNQCNLEKEKKYEILILTENNIFSRFFNY